MAPLCSGTWSTYSNRQALFIKKKLHCFLHAVICSANAVVHTTWNETYIQKHQSTALTMDTEVIKMFAASYMLKKNTHAHTPATADHIRCNLVFKNRTK